MNIEFKKVERVDSYGTDTNMNIDGPGYYKLPVRKYCGDKYYVWVKRNVIKVSHNFDTTLIITQNPRKKSDVQMYYYNGSEQLFKVVADMESRRYRKSVWYGEWDNCTKEAEDFFSCFCELYDKYNPIQYEGEDIEEDPYDLDDEYIDEE